ncbi:MAG: response regulator [Agitococcus sp.]|nr:response regulator [Agitococcus sp.]
MMQTIIPVLPVEVLLVEDNALDAEMTMVTLRSQRLANRIEWLQDGEIALDYLYCRGSFLGRDPVFPKLILLDLKLPKVDGLDLLRVLKNDSKLSHIPVVMLTSSAEESDLLTSYDLGVNSYVVKPVDFDQFNAEIAKLGFYWMLINKTPAL